MMFGCPGSQKFKQPFPEVVRCANCASEAEVWTDEAKAVCPNCGNSVSKAGGQSCLDWCRYARQCVGDEVYDKYMNGKVEHKEKKEV